MSVVNPQYEDVESSSHSSEITVEVSSSIQRNMYVHWRAETDVQY